ncbi:MAG: nucleotidyltransferase family protein [Anaerolineae bacterium]
MSTKEQIITTLRENYPYLAAEYGVKRIGLFGSYAGGAPHQESDVDLVVEFDSPPGFKFIELVEYLESLLGQKVDILTPAGIRGIRLPYVAQRIQESIIYVGANR